MVSEVFFCVVRKNEAHEWLDIKTISHSPTIAMENAVQTNKNIPHWAKDNPIVRVIRVEATEINWPKVETNTPTTDPYQLIREALADLEGIMPEFEPSGDRTHPAWETIERLKAAIEGRK
jgi:hypothetical protein